MVGHALMRLLIFEQMWRYVKHVVNELDKERYICQHLYHVIADFFGEDAINNRTFQHLENCGQGHYRDMLSMNLGCPQKYLTQMITKWLYSKGGTRTTLRSGRQSWPTRLLSNELLC